MRSQFSSSVSTPPGAAREALSRHWEVDANHLFNPKAVLSQTVKRRESRFTLAGKLDNSAGVIESRQLEFLSMPLTNQRGRLVALDGKGQYWRVNSPLDNASGTQVNSQGG